MGGPLVHHSSRRRAHRLWVGFAILAFVISASLFAGTANVEAGRGDHVAWCHNGDKWLAFAAGVPGSTSREAFTQCLRASADRGEIVALDGVMLDHGALIQAGDGAIYWEFEVGRETKLNIIVRDDHIQFGDTCDRRIELRAGHLQTTAPGFPCDGRERIEQRDLQIPNPDFTIFVVGRQFIAVGDDGWYHIPYNLPTWNTTSQPAPQFTLTNRWPGIWITTAEEHGPISNRTFFLRQPLTGNISQLNYHLFTDWEARVRHELIPVSFSHASYDFFPDRNAYWRVMKETTEAIFEDLFHSRTELHALDLEAIGWGLMDTSRWKFFLDSASASDMLIQVAHAIVGPNAGYGDTLNGTLFLLWNRYIPDFDGELALALADRYGVTVGTPVAVDPVSDLTATVNRVLHQSPPAQPSDDEPTAPDELLRNVHLRLGQTYSSGDDILVVSPDDSPSCIVTESYYDGTTYQLRHSRSGSFTVGLGVEWNGLTLETSGGKAGISRRVVGTPTQLGRIRVEVTTKCPGGDSQEPTVVGFTDIEVVQHYTIEGEPEVLVTGGAPELVVDGVPVVRSNHTDIAREYELGGVGLTVGETYDDTDHRGFLRLKTADPIACVVKEEMPGGDVVDVHHPAHLTFELPDYIYPYFWSWNGIVLEHPPIPTYDEAQETYVLDIRVKGVPREPGQVLVNIKTKCPGGLELEPRLVGYGWIFVFEPDDWKP